MKTNEEKNDYGDGEDVTHYLGNDDYKKGNKLEENSYSDPVKKDEVGKVANGNDLASEQATGE